MICAQKQWGLRFPEVSMVGIIIITIIIESCSQDAKIILETADGDKDQRLGRAEFTNQMLTMIDIAHASF